MAEKQRQVISIFKCNKCGHLQDTLKYCVCGAGHMELKKVLVEVIEEVA